jgi:DNA end-binding protein Ku
MAQIAVKLYNATGSEAVSFNMISPKRNRVGQRLFEKLPGSTEDTVIWGEEIKDRSKLLKGYEYAKDQFVYFTDEEVANMQAGKKDSLNIAEFVPVSEIDPLHIEKTYYTAPDKGMDKGYRFLYELLKAHNRAAIGIYVARGKEHLVAIQAFQHGLVLYQLFYNTEVRAFDNKCANIPVSPVELAMGKVLMDTLFKSTFDSSKYSDKFIDKVNKAVAVKLADPMATITEVAVPVSTGGMADTLRASLISMGVPEDQIDAMIAKAMGDIPAVPSGPAAAEPLVLTAPAAKSARKQRAKQAS